MSDRQKPRRPLGIAFGFLIALVLSTATIIYTGLQVTSLSRHADDEQAGESPADVSAQDEDASGPDGPGTEAREEDSEPDSPQAGDEGADIGAVSTNGSREAASAPED